MGQMLQSETDNTTHTVDNVPPIVESVLLNDSGQPLDPITRESMESVFDQDLSQVRVHTGTKAAESAEAVNALAYTAGQNVVFGPGQYAPHTDEGRKLIAHELTHTLQQRQDCVTPDANVQGSRKIMRAPKSSEKEVPRLSSKTIPAPNVTRVGKTILATVYFGHDDFLLDKVNFDAVKNLGQELSLFSNPTVLVDGYASGEGSEEYNAKLSENRRQAVLATLQPNLPKSAKIDGKGHGESDPAVGETAKASAALEKQRALNRRVTIFISGVPSYCPVPGEKTTGLTARHSELKNRPAIPHENVRGFTTADSVKMMWERMRSEKGISSSLRDYKDQWVHANRHIIKAAAKEFDIPDWVLAGTAWQEVGGEPPLTDKLSRLLGETGIRGKPEKASFGPVAIQIGRAAEELCYDPQALSETQTQAIIESLEDPQENILIVAQHLERAKNVDAPGKPAEMLTDDDIRIIGARYNRGIELSLHAILNLGQKTSYGDNIVKKKDWMKKLLED